LAVSVSVSTQAPPQASVPAAQPQAPAAQAWPAGHAMPQVPQFSGSVVTSTHRDSAPVPHTISGAGHASLHEPPTHDSPSGHSVPQAPQFESSTMVSTQAAPQRISPAIHEDAAHDPPMHVSSGPQLRPQVPQFALSLWTSMQPSPQSASPAPHAIMARQVPDEQLSSIEHMFPHVPQLFRSVFVLTQPPPHDVSPPLQPLPSGRDESLPPSVSGGVPSSPQPANVASAKTEPRIKKVRAMGVTSRSVLVSLRVSPSNPEAASVSARREVVKRGSGFLGYSSCQMTFRLSCLLASILVVACSGGRRLTTPTDSGTRDTAPATDGTTPSDIGTGDAAPVCAEPTSAENTPALCSNGIDDDGDGTTDCEDRSCARHPGLTLCRETNCTNLVDDDGDGFIDCEDFDCVGTASCPAPREGTGTCDNGIDDDGDGFVDCDDFDCTGFAGCDAESDCANGLDDDGDGFADCDDFDCQFAGACPGVEVTNEACSDGIDNDGNGFTDCDDLRCARSPAVTICEGNPTTCSDGIDNDCDGFVDCADFGCRNCDEPFNTATCDSCS
jgi:hypothetical protein